MVLKGKISWSLWNLNRLNCSAIARPDDSIMEIGLLRAPMADLVYCGLAMCPNLKILAIWMGQCLRLLNIVSSRLFEMAIDASPQVVTQIEGAKSLDFRLSPTKSCAVAACGRPSLEHELGRPKADFIAV